MKLKNIPRKIFIMILITGFLAVMGEVILTADILTLSGSYRVMSDEHFENMSDATQIRMLLHRHQAVVASHVSASTAEKYEEYEKYAADAEKELREKFKTFGVKMTGGERERIFHTAYTAFFSYLDNADNAMTFSREGSKGVADYYVVSVMDNCVKQVNSAFDSLNEFIEREISSAKKQMDRLIQFSIITAAISVPVIAAMMIISSFYCFKITSNLSKYKDELERDVEAKSAALRERTEKMLRIQNNTVMGMANLIESRDGDTGEHVKRTSVYVTMLAKAAQKAGYKTEILTDDYIELLGKAAPLHDIGKISISDTILLKPGKLTASEYEQMKMHAQNGGRIVRDVIGGIEEKDYVDIAADVAAYHHERWGGSGYNEGLKGEEIPLCARIMAVADVFDALISPRCYKPAMSLDDAFEIIKESAGEHFDPFLARIFLELRPEIERYIDGENQPTADN